MKYQVKKNTGVGPWRRRFRGDLPGDNTVKKKREEVCMTHLFPGKNFCSPEKLEEEG